MMWKTMIAPNVADDEKHHLVALKSDHHSTQTGPRSTRNGKKGTIDWVLDVIFLLNFLFVYLLTGFY